MPLEFKTISSLSEINATQWNALTDGNPTLAHEFLNAMHESQSACAATGWVPQYITAWDSNHFKGAIPLYEKHHSYGEYVFDWAWADAYQRHRLQYYPKLLAALPFTPTTGFRILASDDDVRHALSAELLRIGKLAHVSSIHVLFPSPAEVETFKAQGFLVRQGVQFHWRNNAYKTFDDFLASLNKDKRKKIKQERRYALESGVAVTHRVGAEITENDWNFFYRCYVQTYREHRSTPYLTRDFFTRLAETFADHCLLSIATFEGKPVAASFCLIGGNDQVDTEGKRDRRMYGRYWGSIAHVPHLHFELCYYAPIEYAITHGFDVFEGGAQGEHKLARGLEPVATQSCHWLSHPGFFEAVEAYTKDEAQQMELYRAELEQRRPFKN